MLSHYFKLARKVLLKNGYYTLINVFGLVSGMLSALVIAKYIGGSLEVDRFHHNKNRIYFVSQQETVQGNPTDSRNATYYGVGEQLNQFPEITHFTRYFQHVESLMLAKDKKGDPVTFTESKIFIADASFLHIFTFPLIYGDHRLALAKVNSIVLTKSSAEKYFGNANPIGNPLTIRAPWGQENTYTVTGVIENIPQRSRFVFDFLITQEQIDPQEFWHAPDCATYMLLKDDVNNKALADKITNSVAELPQLKSANKKVVVSLTSIADAGLSTTEYLLAAVGIFITLVCWLNYINQVAGQSFWRTKEVGVLRVVGATKTNLRMQFVIESAMICSVSLMLVIGIYLTFESTLQSLTNGHLLPLIGDSTMVNVVFLAIFLVGTIVASFVPAVILFSENVGATLRSVYNTKVGGISLRKALVVIQFSISTVLMTSFFVTMNQLEYVSKKDKGLTMKDILVVKTPLIKDTTWHVKRKTLELFKERCRQLPFVSSITSSTTVPGESYRQETYISLHNNSTKALIHQAGVDEHFFAMYEMQFVAGHDFIPDARAENRTSIILNKSAARALGVSDFDRVTNTRIVDHEDPDAVYDLIGIVNDHHQTSLKNEMRPMAFRFNEFRGHFSIKINNVGSEENGSEQLSALKEVWDETYPNTSFDAFILEDKYEAENMEDRYFEKLFKFFTALSIIISCTGLFGLSLLISVKRQKEIAIRKTFGASSTSILANFLQGYVAPLSIAVIIGSTLAYFLMNMWLTTYAYRIQIGFNLISVSVLCLIVVFLLTVSYHTIKSSFTNPVSILKE